MRGWKLLDPDNLEENMVINFYKYSYVGTYVVFFIAFIFALFTLDIYLTTNLAVETKPDGTTINHYKDFVSALAGTVSVN